MRALRRILVALLGLLSLGLTGLIATALINHAFAARFLDYLDRCALYNLELCFLESRNLWCPLLVAAVALILGVLLLAVAFYRQRPIKQVTVETLDGASVHVSLNAIDNVVQRAANQVPGVTNVTDKLHIAKNGLHIQLSFSLPTDCHVAELGAELRREISSQLETMMGVRPASIDISVVNVSEQPSGRQPAAMEAPAPAPMGPDQPVDPAQPAEEAQHGLE